MEEILASIRRIIADDDTVNGPPAASDPMPPPSPAALAQPASQENIGAAAPGGEQQSSEIFDLTDEMRAPATGHAEGLRTLNDESDVVFEHSREESLWRKRDREPPPRAEPAQRQGRSDERALLSSLTSAAVETAFNTLAHTVLVQNARTLEDLVREMLRPLLKTWLDDNLPDVVERLVRAEIERVSRGRS